MIRSKYPISFRTHLYLTVVGVRNLLMGGLLLLFPTEFSNSAFQVAFDRVPKTLWGSAMVLVAVGLAVAILTRHFVVIRILVVASGVIMAMLAASAIANILIIHNNVSSLWPPIVFLAICAKDFIIVSLPYTHFPGLRLTHQNEV